MLAGACGVAVVEIFDLSDVEGVLDGQVANGANRNAGQYQKELGE